jgi:hypothetical protein
MFIYCFDDKTKEELIIQGLKFLKEDLIQGKKAYVFMNDKGISFFNNKNVYCTNRLNF